MPRKLYKGWAGVPQTRGRLFVKTGARRAVKLGEFFLTENAKPGTVVFAETERPIEPKQIMRPATPEESRCPSCRQPLPYVNSGGGPCAHFERAPYTMEECVNCGYSRRVHARA